MKMGLMGFCFAITIIFIVAKLAEVIAWSWWLVFLPAIIAAGIAVLLLFLLIALAILAAVVENGQ